VTIDSTTIASILSSSRSIERATGLAAAHHTLHLPRLVSSLPARTHPRASIAYSVMHAVASKATARRHRPVQVKR
jgi:hypothetical protein